MSRRGGEGGIRVTEFETPWPLSKSPKGRLLVLSERMVDRTREEENHILHR